MYPYCWLMDQHLELAVSKKGEISHFNILYWTILGFPWWLRGKEFTYQCRRCGFYPWVKKVSWRRKWWPPPVFLPGKSHGQKSLACYSPWGSKRVRHNLVTKQQQNNRTILRGNKLCLLIKGESAHKKSNRRQKRGVLWVVLIQFKTNAEFIMENL